MFEQPFSAVSGPESTEIEYRDTDEELNPPSTIEITNDGDKPYEVDHPWIKGDVQTNPQGLIDARAEVTVAYPRGHDFTMSFERYLQTIGLNYDRYQTYYKHHQTAGLATDFRRMHQAAIEHRGQTARYLKDKWRKENSEAQQRSQQESTTVHSYIWRKIFDLGIDGLDAEVPWDYRGDYLDGIDEFVFFNKTLLSGNETQDASNEDIFAVGVQRSHKDKAQEVARDPLRYIPEHPEYGPVFRVFMPDISDLYNTIKGKLKDKLDDRLALASLQAGVPQREYVAKKAAENNVSPDEFRLRELEKIKLSKVLRHGQSEQMQWASHILTSVSRQLEQYKYHPKIKNDQSLIQRLDATIETLGLALQAIEEERQSSAK